MAKLAHPLTEKVERKDRKMTWARISSPQIVQSGKILQQKGENKGLKNGLIGTMLKLNKNTLSFQGEKRDCDTSLEAGIRPTKK